MSREEFAGRKIIVFGASSGIGRSCAIRLGKRGAEVILVGRNRERLEEAAGHIPEGRGVILPCDVSDFDAAQAVVKDAVKLDGAKLDGCVFSVGIAGIYPIIAVRKEHLLESFQTNLFSLAGILKAFASRRVSRDGASFVGLSSGAAIGPVKGQSVYAATKGAMNAYISVAAKELAPRRIRVNAICPEMVDTPMGAGLHLLPEERLRERYPLGVLTADDIADTALYLLSDAAGKITGQAISVTAGSAGGNDNFVF